MSLMSFRLLMWSHELIGGFDKLAFLLGSLGEIHLAFLGEGKAWWGYGQLKNMIMQDLAYSPLLYALVS